MEIILIVVGIVASCFILPAIYEALAVKAYKRAYGTKNAINAVHIYKTALQGTTENDLAILEKLTK